MKFTWMFFNVLVWTLWSASAGATEILLSLDAESPKEAQYFISALKKIRENPGVHEKLILQGASYLSDFASPAVSTLALNPSWDAAYQRADKNGDMYILWGNLGNSWNQDEYQQFYSISKWLVQHYFRNIINPVATEADIREAVANPRTAGIIWSSHGDDNGRVFSALENPISRLAFFENASLSFRHMLLSNCNGEQTVQYYSFPSWLKVHHWIGETTTDDLFGYLESGKWAADLQEDLGIQF